MRLTGSILALAFSLAVSGCSDDAGKVSGPGAEEASAGETASAPVTGEVATSSAATRGETEGEEPAEVVETCHAGPQTYCRGPVMVRVGNVVLSKTGEYSGGRMDVAAKATFTVENRTDSPIKFNMLRRAVTKMSLANGVELNGDSPSTKPTHISGLTPCLDDMADCVTMQQDDFVILEPGESPATFNVTYQDRVKGGEAVSLPRVESADVNVQLVVLSPDGGSRKISASFSQVPLFNSLAN